MTNGTAIMLGTAKTVMSCEFSDFMYLNPNGFGRVLLDYLERTRTEIGFIDSISRFTQEYFGRGETPICYPVKRFRRIVFKDKTYRRDWFSDFLFFLNLGAYTVRFVDRDGKRLDLLPGEIMVFYLGRFYSLSHNFKAYERALESVPA